MTDKIDLRALRLLTNAVHESFEPPCIRIDGGEPRVVEPEDWAEAFLRQRTSESEEADPILHVAMHEHDRNMGHRLLSLASEKAIHSATNQIEERQERLRQRCKEELA